MVFSLLGLLSSWLIVGLGWWFVYLESPYERDCYLGAPFESQTTNPNQQITISWFTASLSHYLGCFAFNVFLQCCQWSWLMTSKPTPTFVGILSLRDSEGVNKIHGFHFSTWNLWLFDGLDPTLAKMVDVRIFFGWISAWSSKTFGIERIEKTWSVRTKT